MTDQEELKREKERLKEAHANLFKYQKYLEATVEVSAEQYEEVEDILNRHKTLATTQADLKDSLAKEAVGLESLRADLNALKRATQNTILVHNSEIHRHQKKIEALRSQSVQMDMQHGEGGAIDISQTARVRAGDDVHQEPAPALPSQAT